MNIIDGDRLDFSTFLFIPLRRKKDTVAPSAFISCSLITIDIISVDLLDPRLL